MEPSLREAAFTITMYPIALTILLTGAAIWKHLRVAARFHTPPLALILKRQEVFNLQHLRIENIGVKLPLKAPGRDLVASFYLMLAVFFLIEAGFGFLDGVGKSLIMNKFAAFENYNFLAFVVLSFIILLLFELVSGMIINHLSDGNNKSFTQRVADTNLSAANGSTRRASVKEDVMSTELIAPKPLSVEDYRLLISSPNYKEYLTQRERQRREESHEVHPIDGKPTDEAILADYLNSLKR